MKVNEIFYSIQGEGHRIGTPNIFIRLSGCNLKCPFCFGIIGGRYKPQIVTTSKRKRLNEIVVGDELITIDNDQDFNFVATKVVRVIEREVTAWYNIKIGGKEYYVTPEHQFFTKDGLKSTSELKVGDRLIRTNGFKDKYYVRMTFYNSQKKYGSTPEKVKADTKWFRNSTIDSIQYVTSGTRVPFAKNEPKWTFWSPLKVYNFECSPYNTYLIDYIWVHNCDTNHEPYNEYTDTEILTELNKYPCKNVIITGGEPTIQNIAPLVKMLKTNGYYVALETNGINSTKGILLDWVTVSPKTPLHSDYLFKFPNEIKIVIDKNTDIHKYIKSFLDVRKMPIIFLQPEGNKPENIQHCIELIKKDSRLRLSGNYKELS